MAEVNPSLTVAPGTGYVVGSPATASVAIGQAPAVPVPVDAPWALLSLAGLLAAWGATRRRTR